MFYFLICIWEKIIWECGKMLFGFIAVKCHAKLYCSISTSSWLRVLCLHKTTEEKTWRKQFTISILREGCFHAYVFNSIVSRWAISLAKCWKSFSSSSYFLLRFRMLSLLVSFNFFLVRQIDLITHLLNQVTE